MCPQTTDTRWLNPWFYASQIPIPNKYLEFGYKGLVFCRNNGWLMENMDKGLTVPKWVLINQPKISQMPQNLSAQIACLRPKVWDFHEKRLHWASVVRVCAYACGCALCIAWHLSMISNPNIMICKKLFVNLIWSSENYKTHFLALFAAPYYFS